MARTTSFSQVLWFVTMGWLAACGRLGFDDGSDGAGNKLPDASVAKDAAIDAPPVGPKIALGSAPTMTAMCGQSPGQFKYPISNPGDQDLVITSADVAGGGSGAAVFKVVTMLPLTIPAGATAELVIQPPTPVVGTDRANTVKTSTVTLATNAPGNRSFDVALSSTVTGANIDVQVVGAGGLDMDFNGTGGNCPTGTKQVKITNTGTVAASVNVAGISGSGAAYTSGFTSGTLAAGTNQTATYRPFLSSGCTATGEIAVTATAASGDGICTDNATVAVTLIITGASSGCPSCS